VRVWFPKRSGSSSERGSVRWNQGDQLNMSAKLNVGLGLHGDVSEATMGIDGDRKEVPAGKVTRAVKSDAAVSRRNLCLRTGPSILNRNVLPFDVTSWPRRAIAELAARVQNMKDPLNREFSKASIEGLKVHRIEEADDQETLSSPTFEFYSGCYLLMIVSDRRSAAGS